MIRRWFDKRGSTPPSTGHNDTALQLLNSDWQCACCGERHHGIMDLAAGWPDHWGNDDDARQPNSLLDCSSDFLSSDFCVIGGESFFIRAILEIPVHGLDRPWAWGCWTTLSRANFDTYVDRFDESFGTDEVWSGWLCNRLRIYHEGNEPLAVTVHPQPERQRPKLLVQSDAHPLGKAQRKGITAEALLALFQAYGHGPTVQ